MKRERRDFGILLPTVSIVTRLHDKSVSKLEGHFEAKHSLKNGAALEEVHNEIRSRT